MKKYILLLTTINLFTVASFSQTTEVKKNLKTQTTDTLDGWKKGGVISLGMTQTSLTNWAAGGESSISANGIISLFANYKKGKGNWDNTLDIGYGILKQGKNASIVKTDDKIDLMSKYGQKAFKNWYYTGLLNFKTQMTAGYNYPNDSVKISDLLAPAYLLGAIGMDYKPSADFTAFIAPVTTKITFVNDPDLADAGDFGVESATYDTTGEVLTTGANIRTELGGYIRLFYKKELMENISLQTKLDLFSNYTENPQNIDISWEILIAMKVNKYITANITTHLIYDDDIDISVDIDGDDIIDAVGPRTQFKEVLSIGFSYKF